MSDLNAPEPNKGVSRRTVTTAMAWAVPAIAIAAPAPAFAVSASGPTVGVNDGGKLPGASCSQFGFIKDYVFLLTFTNPSSTPVYIYMNTEIIPPSVDYPDGVDSPVFNVTAYADFSFEAARLFTAPSTIGGPVPTSLQIAGGGFQQVLVNAGPSGASPFDSLTGSIFFAWGHAATPGDDLDHPYIPVPPPGAPIMGEGWIDASFTGLDMNPTRPFCYPN